MERTEEEKEGGERECVSVCVISKVHRIFLASRLIVLFPLFSTATELTRYCVWMIGECWHKRSCLVDDQFGRSIHRVVLVAGCFSGSAGGTSVISGRHTLCQVEGHLRVHVLFDRFTKELPSHLWPCDSRMMAFYSIEPSNTLRWPSPAMVSF